MFGRSLIREVDAGSCNGCEVEIVGLNSPIYDIERFGIHFVASPRHADMLLVTDPVTRNMELALRKTYDAMPAPRLVVAVGACGCSGGIFGQNYASLGGVDQVIQWTFTFLAVHRIPTRLARNSDGHRTVAWTMNWRDARRQLSRCGATARFMLWA
jgi:Ni,Fe-hydrogenase III small subunit